MNKEVFEKAKDVLMNPADVIAEACRSASYANTQVLYPHLESQSEAWVQDLVLEAKNRCGDADLENWDLVLTCQSQRFTRRWVR